MQDRIPPLKQNTSSEGFYLRNYLDNLKKNQITLDHELPVIAEYIFDNSYRQPYPAYFPHFTAISPLRSTLAFKAQTKNGNIERESHGVQHVSRAAVEAVVVLNLYLNFGSDDIRNNIGTLVETLGGGNTGAQRLVKCLQIAAMFHDAGRLGEGADQEAWERDGGNQCAHFLQALGMNERLARRFGDAAAGKDELCTDEKDILKKLIQSADCLEIQRCPMSRNFVKNIFSRNINHPMTRPYSIDYLDIWRDATSESSQVIPRDKKVALQKEVIQLALSSRTLISEQGDLNNSCPISVTIKRQPVLVSPGIALTRSEVDKRKYEHGNFSVMTDDLTHPAHKKQAFLSKWFNSGNMLPLDGSKNLAESAISAHLSSASANGVEIDAIVPAIDETIVSTKHRLISQFLLPLQKAIDQCSSVDQFTVSLINLKHQLTIRLESQYSAAIATNTLTSNMLDKSEFKDIPKTIETMTMALRDVTRSKQQKLAAITEANQILQPVLKSTLCKVAASVAFIAFAAIGAVVGATLGVLLGAAAGSVGHLPGMGLGAITGFVCGAAKGWAIGGCVAGAVGLGSIAGSLTLWSRNRAGIREALHTVLNQAEAVTQVEPRR